MGYFRVVVCILWLQDRCFFKHLKSLFENCVSSTTISSKKSRHVIEQISIFSFIELHSHNELIKLLEDVINVIFSGQKIETVNSKSLYILSIFHKHFLDGFQGLLPITVDHMDLCLFQQGWEEVFVLN
jgi:hypothetical protein